MVGAIGRLLGKLESHQRKRARATALIAEGDQWLAKEFWGRAVDCYAPAVEIITDDADLWARYGDALRGRGSPRLALDAYEKSLALQSNLQIYLRIAWTYDDWKRADFAARFFLEACKIDPTLLVCWTKMCDAGWPVARMRRGVFHDIDSNIDWMSKDRPAVFICDVSDLVAFVSASAGPLTGIQRLQAEIVTALIDHAPQGSLFAAVAYHQESESWRQISSDLIRRLRDGESSGAMRTSTVGRLHIEFKAGEAIEMRKGDCLVDLGTSWWETNHLLHIRALKARGVSFAPFLHDCIPALFPEVCVDSLPADYCDWLPQLLRQADILLVNSQSTGRDAAALAKVRDVQMPPVAVIRPDGGLPRKSAGPSAGRQPDHPFVLMVGTIEPRKNHLFVLEAWQDMMARLPPDEVPKLICVGRLGWKYEPVLERLSETPQLASHVELRTSVPDEELVELYGAAKFIIVPSLYEGWGLAITEALSFGKACLAADVGGMPEAGGAFADYFIGGDRKDFTEKLLRLWSDAHYRNGREANVKANWQPRPWPAIADDLRQAVAALKARPVSPLLFDVGSERKLYRNRGNIPASFHEPSEGLRWGPGWWPFRHDATRLKPGGSELTFVARGAGASGRLILECDLAAAELRGARVFEMDKPDNALELGPDERGCLRIALPAGEEAKTVRLGIAVEGKELTEGDCPLLIKLRLLPAS